MAYINKIKTYALQDGFYIEVDNARQVSSFYMCHQDYGHKLYMFGLCDIDNDSIEDIINNCADTYINEFLGEFGTI